MKSDVPLVSVVVPTRYRPEMLMKCVASILAQTVCDIEVIVVVDGPDSGSVDVLSNVQDPRLRYVTHPQSLGVSNARNAGIGLATGQWVAFCDDDDIWAQTKLAAQLTALSATPSARWAIAGAIRVNQDRGTASYAPPPTAEEVAAVLPFSNPVPGGCSGVIADRRHVIELGGFDPRLSTFADWCLWIRLNWHSVVAVAAEPLVGYRQHGGAMTRRLRNIEHELEVIRSENIEQFARYGRRFPADDFYLWTYTQTFRTGDWRGGLDLLARSPHCRAVIARHVWAAGNRRLRARFRGAAPSQCWARQVTVEEFPWLNSILGAESATDGASHRPGV